LARHSHYALWRGGRACFRAAFTYIATRRAYRRGVV